MTDKSQCRADTLEELRRNARTTGETGIFEEEDIRAIDDPVEAVAWIEQRQATMAKWAAENASPDDVAPDDDPAKTIHLTEDERDWLAGFLPELVPPSE